VATYDSIISRTDAAALIPEEAANAILTDAATSSLALQTFRHIPMARGQFRIPAIAALPTAYFVNGDTGLKQTTEATWTNKYLNAEELACIVPIPEAVLDDTSFDVWGEVRPMIAEAIGAALDAAVFFGTNKPANWGSDIMAGATAASHVTALGTGVDLAEDISVAFGLVEADGNPVNFAAAAPSFKASLRGLRDQNDALLFMPSMQAGTPGTIYGEAIRYADNGAFDTAAALLIVGDSRKGLLGVRRDLTYKVLDQAVIQDGNGAIVYNLAQQDMVALRVTARFAWEQGNVPKRLTATPYAFAAVTPT
jgi:HK97 family phage major capsid protein